MASIRSTDTRPERLLRSALWRHGLRGFRCHWRGPGGRVDIAFTRWQVAVFVDGSFWHGHPSKWQPGRWSGYWDEKIKRNIARDARQDAALADAGWRVLRCWDFEVEQNPLSVAERVANLVDESQLERRS
jgi:DNA mismatch endonuclease (patch repair protein)